MINECTLDGDAEEDILVSSVTSGRNIRAVTWEIVQEETRKDPVMQKLMFLINSTFPGDKSELPAELTAYWPIRDSLYATDGVILMRDRIVLPTALRSDALETGLPGSDRIIIPSTLRGEIMNSLHSAHQGITRMNERARAGVYWPGITSDIIKTRQSCGSCNRNMPSQARTPPLEAHIPTTPFEAIACDYFHFAGKYYFVAADRLSGWVEVSNIKVGTNDSGAQGLCTALRRLMVTFGVPAEISSDGGPEFSAGETQSFFKRWGIKHRLSSVAFPSSNGRAELAVKAAKRLLENNIGADGQLNNDSMVRALLTLRNTPDPGCKLSPAQIVLGRQLRDSMPFINKNIMMYNNPQIQPQWREAWKVKEDALRTRYVKTVENLSEHVRPLAPLRHGDHVLIQNQRGRCPNKWNSSGVIVETKPNDQYVVKVTGSGRLTLRNRRFLRLFSPHNLTHSESYTTDTPLHTQQSETSKPISQNKPPQASHNETYNSPQKVTATPSPRVTPQAEHVLQPKRLQFGEFSPQSTGDEQQTSQTPPTTSDTPLRRTPAPPTQSPYSPPVTFTEGRRSSREKKPRKIYDAGSGTFKEPTSVPETL